VKVVQRYSPDTLLYTAYSKGCCCFGSDQALVGDPHTGGYPILTVCGANAGVVSIGGASPVAVDVVGARRIGDQVFSAATVAASRAGSEARKGGLCG
jgi:hypothetical protein